MIFTNSKHWLLYNIIAIIVVLSIFIGLFYISLLLYTRHGQEKAVPDFSSMTVSQAESIAEGYGFKVKVIDSVYIPRMDKGVVYSQNPKPGSYVKDGRRILLVINSISTQKVLMPNLLGLTMRSAISELKSCGLQVGRLIYVSDIATNSVLAQMYDGQNILAGKYVPIDSKISLLLGLNSDDNMTYIPDLIGLKYKDALDKLHFNSLNISSVKFGDNVKNYTDSLNSIVVSQEPADSVGAVVMGSGISLILEKK